MKKQNSGNRTPQRYKGGRPVAKAEVRQGTRLAVCLDNETLVWGEVYDVERMGEQRVARWRSDDGTQTVVLFIAG